MRKKRRETPPATAAIPPAQQWANEQNAHWTPPPPPPADPEPPGRADSADDSRDLRDGVRCVYSGGLFDGRATSADPDLVGWCEERGYAPRLLNGWTQGDGTAVYIWERRRPDGVHVYQFGCMEWESNT
jgi:hypothetical protein